MAPSYPKAWLRKVVADTGDRYRLPDASCAWIDPDSGRPLPPPREEGAEAPAAAGERSGMRPISKLEVRGVMG